MEMKLKSLFGFSDSLIENFPDAILIIDARQHIKYLNKKAEALFGYTKKEIQGRNVAALFYEDAHKIFLPAVNEQNLVLKFINKGGREEYVEITRTSLKDEVVMCARNVTHLQTTVRSVLAEYEKTKRISQNKNGFITNLANELRNPMHSIIGFSQALLDGLGGGISEKQQKYVSIINRNASNLFDLINSILDISKIEAGLMEFNFKTFDMMQIVNLVVESINPMTEEKKLKFEVDTAGLLKRNCYSDEHMVRQVLMNVLNNAVKYTDAGGISLTVNHPELDYLMSQGIILRPNSTDKSYLLFSVADTGVGIPAGELNNIFEEYRQIDRSNNKKQSGSGLGLAITRKLLEELGGAIWVESELNKGSIFRFVIPIDRPVPQEVKLEDKQEEIEVKEVRHN